MKGQLSAEMLILIVVVLAVVAIAAGQIMGTAKSASATIGNQTGRIGMMASESIKSAEGGFCIEDSDCMDSLSCDAHRCA
jgi:hypothetical protein